MANKLISGAASSHLAANLKGRLEPDPDQKAAAPEIQKAQEPASQEIKKRGPKPSDRMKMSDVYSRQTYWIRKEFSSRINDYAYTEGINIRQAINRLLTMAFDQVEKEYQAEGKELKHGERERFSE